MSATTYETFELRIQPGPNDLYEALVTRSLAGDARVDFGGTLNALIPTFVLTRTATYTIAAGRAGSSALYRLSLASSQPLTLTLDSSIEVTRSGAFRFSGCQS